MASIQSKTTKKGETVYYVVASKAGRRKWLRAGSLQNARQLLKQVESLVDSDKIEKLGLNPKDPRIDDFLKDHMDQVRLRTAPATLKRYRCSKPGPVALRWDSMRCSLKMALARTRQSMRRIRIMTLVLSALLSACSCSEEKGLTPDISAKGPLDANPAWSHAGDRIAYFSYVDSTGLYAPGIYVVDSSGYHKTPIREFGLFARWTQLDTGLLICDGEIIFLYRFRDSSRVDFDVSSNSPPFDVSLDDRYVYFAGNALDALNPGGVYELDLAGNSVRRIGDGGHPSLAPDGNSLAYARGYIYIRSLEDTMVNRLSSSLGQLPTWTRDGMALIYNDAETHLILHPIAGSPTVLVEGFGASSISPDGTRLLFIGVTPDTNGYQHLWEYRLDNSHLRRFSR